MTSNPSRSMIRRFLARGTNVAAVLLLFSAAQAAFASSVWYVNTYAYSADGGAPFSTPPFEQVSGDLTYNSNTGGTVTIGPAGTTTYSNPTALGLTSAESQTTSSQYIDDYCSAGNACVTGTLTSSAMAKGNLATGSVGISALPSVLPVINPSNGNVSGYTGSDAYATAEINDVLTFNVAGANSSTVTDIGVSFTVDGNLSYNNSANGNALLTDLLNLGGATANYNFDSENAPATQNSLYKSGWVSTQVTAETADSFIFSGVYALDGTSDQVAVFLELATQCLEDATCDFSNTGAISFTLPSNVTFTSASGVFLTQPLTATPEPASEAILLGVLLVVGGALKRLRRASAV
jgi:hypothetical protein